MNTKLKYYQNTRISLSKGRFREFMLLTFLVLFVSGCINLREDYPEIEYYELQASSTEPSRIKVDGILQVRPFGGSNVLSSRRFMVEKSTGGVDKYYYHRWSDDFQELFTWTVISRMSNQKLFTGGIVNQGTALLPNYILEGDILKLRIYNDEKDKTDSSFVEMSVKITLQEFIPDSSGLKVIYTNVYDKRVARKSNKAPTIAPAVNIAANEIISMFSEDIVKAINK